MVKIQTDYNYRIGILICLLFLAGDLAVISADVEPARWVTKPGIVLSLIILLLLLRQQIAGRTFDLWLLALICSLAGDVFLLFSSDRAFLAGLGSFLLAHMAYIFLFIRLPTDRAAGRRNIFSIFIIAFIGFIIFDSLIVSESGGYFWPVLAYSIVILTMWVFAALRTITTVPTNLLLGLGASLFVCSDSLLGYNLFVSYHYFINFMVMFTYGLAQLFIFIGLRKILKKNRYFPER